MSQLMGKALERRKSRGLDLTIIIGAPKGTEAPSVHTESAEEVPAPVGEESELPPEEGLPSQEPAHEEGQDPSDMISGLNDYEKDSLMNDKPRSLMDRVKQAQLKAKMKG